jgi:hypothetical protein
VKVAQIIHPANINLILVGFEFEGLVKGEASLTHVLDLAECCMSLVYLKARGGERLRASVNPFVCRRTFLANALAALFLLFTDVIFVIVYRSVEGL